MSRQHQYEQQRQHAREEAAMENLMVAGSRTKKELSVSASIVIDDDVAGPSESHGQLPCAICQQAIGVDAEGREFVPCECAYRICRPCYEYIRAQEGNRCPQCLAKYRRLPGSPPVDDDPPEEVIRHLEESILDGPATALPAATALAPSALPLFSSAPQLALEGPASSPPSSSVSSASPAAATPLDLPSAAPHPAAAAAASSSHPGTPGAHASGSSTASGKHASATAAGSNGVGEQGSPASVVAAGGASPGGSGDESASSASAGSPSSYGYGSIVWFTPRRQWSALAPSGAGAPGEGASAAAAGAPEGVPSTAIVPVRDANASAGAPGAGGGEGGHGVVPIDGAPADGSPFIVDDTRRPLSRKVPVPSSMLNPYRFAVVVRFVVMILFFKFRITNPNNSAFLLWLASVVCEIWFGISWIFDQMPKWSPITRETFLNRLSLRYEQEGRPCELPQVDVFVSTADPLKEPPLVTANVILSVLAADYPVDKVACYLSDDGASMLTFEALMETANFSRLWVPFCRKHAIEPRAPEMYFAGGVDYLLGKVNADFVKERRRMKREYDEFKVRMNALVVKAQDSPREGWTMPDGTAWPGNDRTDHVGMIQVFLQPNGETKDVNGDPLPYLVYVSREKRPNYDHNKKAGAMNAMMRASALLTNAPFILNLDCDHYVNNSCAIREAICFLADPLKGGRVCFVQFPQRFDGVDKNDRYANHNTVFYDVNMKGLDGQQGPMYVGTGCVFRRQALYGFDPPSKMPTKRRTCCSLCPAWLSGRPSPVRLPSRLAAGRAAGGTQQGELGDDGAGAFSYGGRVKRRGWEEGEEAALLPTRWHVKRFGLCHNFIMTVFDGVGGSMATEDPHEVLSDVILVISCGYEDNTEWGTSCGWVYGSVTEDIVTGYKMHTRGWRSVYCMPPRPAFKGSAPINMTDRLAQVLRWATGSVEIFFSQHNPVWADCCSHLKLTQRIAYMNTALYPFTSLALTVYCFLPAISLFSGQFIVPNIDNWAVLYFLALFLSIFATALLEIRWSGVSLEEWWRNEQFWVIGGTSAHFAAVMQGLLKVVAGVEVHFTLTSKASQDMEDELAELYTVRWTWLFLIPLTIIIVNAFAILAGVAHAINNWQSTDSTVSGYGHPIKAPTSNADQIGQLVGQVFFSVWVLLHLYPFTKGLMGRSNRMPTLVIVWAMLLAIVLSLLWARISMN
ncbi:hypothetical protein CLOM_g17293 [Closterium sp. NIES-68]|nr:hypothetical protein CLOM_g17293 [Closterium sp. NIES-68]